MPVISVGGTREGDAHVVSRQAATSRGGNGTLSWALLALLALSPLPLGSNRPFFWSISAVYVGLIGTIYFLSLWISNKKLRVQFNSIRTQLFVFSIFCLYLIFQMLPIAHLLGISPVAATAGAVVQPSTISLAPGSTFLMLLRMGSYGVFFFLMLQVTVNAQRAAFIMDALLAIIIVYALVGLFSLQSGDTILGIPKWSYLGSATGTFVNRNSFATFLAIGATLATTRAISVFILKFDGYSAGANPKFRMVAYAMVYALLVSTVVATQSRMGLFVTVAGTVTPILLAIGQTSRSRIVMTALLLLGIMTLATALVFYGGGLLERVGRVEESAAIRFSLYKQIVAMIYAHPWTGSGGGTFDLAFPLVHQLPVSPDVVWDRAHNTYLALFSETGVIFGALPILIFLLTAGRIFWALTTQRGNWGALTLALSVMVVGALHSLVDFSLEIQANTFVFLGCVAIGCAASTVANKREPRLP